MKNLWTQTFLIAALLLIGLTGCGSDSNGNSVPDGGQNPVEPLGAIVATETCNTCHDQLSAHGGQYTEVDDCITCHAAGDGVESDKVFHTLVHGKHIGRSNEVVGNCLACHPESSEVANADAWKLNPTAEACVTCHSDVNFATGEGHSIQTDNTLCASCHTDTANDYEVYSAHRGKVDRKLSHKGQFDYVVRDAKLVNKDGEYYAQVSLEGLDMNGDPVMQPAEELAYLWGAEFYLNWGASSDFAMDRSMTVNAKSAKGLPNSPIVSTAGGVFTYEVGPIQTIDPVTGEDLLGGLGFISNRVGTKLDPEGNYVTDGSYDWNASWNWRVWFDKDGVVEDRIEVRPEGARPVVVTNAKCGSCHGYNEEKQMTELNCRSCHSAAKAEFGTTCSSGNTDGVNQIVEKSLTPRSKNIGPSTADIVDGCVACHNANLPPTQVIRNAQTKQDDADYLEQLVLSHPDHKIWMHSMHSNNRANQGTEDGIRNVDYPTSLANCTRCHEGETYGLDNLVGRKPLALDYDYGDTYYGLDEANWPGGSSDFEYRGETMSARRFAKDAQADMWVSPAAAVCFSCHGKRAAEAGEDRRQVRSEVRDHMEQMGANFDWTGDPADIPSEMCNACHTLDNIKQVHGL